MTTKKPRKRIMHDFIIDEISMVDVPAQEGAVALFTKGRFCKTTDAALVSAENADDNYDETIASLERQLVDLKARRKNNQPNLKPKEQTMGTTGEADANADAVNAMFKRFCNSHSRQTAAMMTVHRLQEGVGLEKQSSFMRVVDEMYDKALAESHAKRGGHVARRMRTPSRNEIMSKARAEHPGLYQLHQHYADQYRREA